MLFVGNSWFRFCTQSFTTTKTKTRQKKAKTCSDVDSGKAILQLLSYITEFILSRLKVPFTFTYKITIEYAEGKYGWASGQRVVPLATKKAKPSPVFASRGLVTHVS